MCDGYIKYPSEDICGNVKRLNSPYSTESLKEQFENLYKITISDKDIKPSLGNIYYGLLLGPCIQYLGGKEIS